MPKTKSGNQFIVVTTDRYSKIAKAIPVARSTATADAAKFVDHWISTFVIPSTMLTDNDPKFSAKFFQLSVSICT